MAALDFPASPAANQIFNAPTGAVYKWISPAWTPVATMSMTDSDINNAIAASRLAATQAAMSAEDNLIINGTLLHWQRGTSFNGTAGATIMTADRWKLYTGAGSTVAVVQNVQAPGTNVGGEPLYLTIGLQRTVTGPAEESILLQTIEGGLRQTAGQTVTLSFMANATVAGAYYAQLVQSFGTGGSPSAAVYTTLPYTINSANVWERKVLTSVVPSISGKTLGSNNDDYLALYLSAPRAIGNVSIYYTNIDFRLGTTAPAQFLRRPIQQEVALCQRYFQQSPQWSIYEAYTNAGSLTSMEQFDFSVTMRATPTIAIVTPSYSNASGLATDAVSTKNLRMKMTTIAAGSAAAYFYITADAEL